uniref:Transcription elongation factor SPT5 n=1 Tax=Schistocephalus solidus TaxID=70667 RepID=A0A0X3PF05_SCHSO
MYLCATVQQCAEATDKAVKNRSRSSSGSIRWRLHNDRDKWRRKRKKRRGKLLGALVKVMESDQEDVIRRKRRKSAEEESELSESENEEEEDSDEGGMSQSRHRNHKNRRDFSAVKDLFHEEAEVDEEEEEEEEYDDEGALFGPEEDEALESAPSARELDARIRMKELAEQDEEQLERYFQERYESQTYQDRFGGGEGMTDNIVQQERLPGIKDANLWVVRCQMGEEKSTVLALMRKFIAYQLSDTPLQIKSAFAKEGLKGYIYIEAFKQTHVKQAIEGIGALSRSRFQQTLVPIKEMTDVMRVVKETAQLKPGQWVRIKSGLYRDDLAKVEYVEDAQNLVHLKLVPRIDYDRRRGQLREDSNDTEANKKARWKRPPPALFDPNKVADRITTEGSYVIFEGNHYDSSGFLRKDFRINAVIADGIRPTLTELERFSQVPDGTELAAVAAAVATKSTAGATIGPNGEVITASHCFAPGDVVEVCDGDLKNLRGKVVSVEIDDRIIVQPNHSDLHEPIPFSAIELRKFFSQGDHVKVLRGPSANETGLVIHFEPNLAVVLSDLSMTELKVAPKDLRLWQERATPVDTTGHVQLMDLVQVDPQTVGVVTRVDREFISVLTCLGKVVTVKSNTALRRMNIGGPRRAPPQALDRNGNIIQVKDSVRFLEKPYVGMGGDVKYLYRSWAFVYCRTHLENSGIIVVKARQLAQVGGSTQSGATAPGSVALPGGRPPVQALNGTNRGGSAGNRRGGDRVERSMVGKTARIVAGTLKGLTGIICDATANEVLLELHSQFKKVHVLRKNVALLDGSGQLIGGPLGAVTPRATSVREARTPLHGSQTPHAPNMTPRVDSTPLPYAFNPNLATPAHYMGDDVLSTPGYQPWQTPDLHRIPGSSSHSLGDND